MLYGLWGIKFSLLSKGVPDMVFNMVFYSVLCSTVQCYGAYVLLAATAMLQPEGRKRHSVAARRT